MIVFLVVIYFLINFDVLRVPFAFLVVIKYTPDFK